MTPAAGIAILPLALLACGPGDPGVTRAKKLMSTDECLLRFDITLRAGHSEIAPGEGAASRALEAVEAANRRARLPDLPDELNPVIIDTSKVRAFLAGLPRVPESNLEKLRGRVLYLNDPALLLGAASPAAPSAFEKGFELEAGETRAGRIAQARVRIEPDLALARERAGRAREWTSTLDTEVKNLDSRIDRGEASGPEGGALFRARSVAQQKRYAAATVWRDLTALLAGRHPGDAALQQEAREAKEAASRFITAPWTGMPP